MSQRSGYACPTPAARPATEAADARGPRHQDQCGRCAPRSRPGPPPACADALAPRRLRVPTSPPQKSRDGEVGNITALLRKQTGGGTNPETHWGETRTPGTPKRPGSGFPPDPLTCLPKNNDGPPPH